MYATPLCLSRSHPVLSAPLPLSTPPATSLVAAGHSPVVVVVAICSSCMRLPHPRPHPPATSAASLAASGTSAVLVVAREPHMCLQLEQVVRLGGEAVMQVCIGGGECLGSEEAWWKEGQTPPPPPLCMGWMPASPSELWCPPTMNLFRSFPSVKRCVL